MGTTVQDILERNRENIWLLGSGKVGDVSVERNTLLSSTSLSNSQGDTKDGVGTEVGLVGCAVELDEEFINLALVLDVDVLLNDGGSDGLVDVGDGLKDTLRRSVHGFTRTSFESTHPFHPTWSCHHHGARRPRADLDCRLARLIQGAKNVDKPVEAPEGTMARCKPVSVTTSTSTVGLPRES